MCFTFYYSLIKMINKGVLMIYSMTGFGKNILSNDYCSVKTEIKSLNSKFLDVRFRLPRGFSFLEIELMKILKSNVIRGKVDVNVEVQFKKAVKIPKINHDTLNMYMAVLREIQMESEVLDDIRIDHLIHFEDILEFSADTELEEKIGAQIIDSVKKAVYELVQMRKNEGENLRNDLMQRIENLKSGLKHIDSIKDKIFDYWYEKFRKRMESLNVNFDEDRIIQEAGFYAEKSDITEEVVRISSHLNLFTKTLEEETSNGKKLDFISQELHREYNTIGSKSNSSEITDYVVNAKTEIDKIREQVQNIV